MGARLVWAISNFTVFICMLATAILSWISFDLYSSKLHHIIGANKTVKNSALIVFSLLGLPLSVSTRLHKILPCWVGSFLTLGSWMSQITYSVPFSVTAELTAGTGGGQGLCCWCFFLLHYAHVILIDWGYFFYQSPGLATGVLNLAIVVPQVSMFIRNKMYFYMCCHWRCLDHLILHYSVQIVVSLGAGPWDALFGGGNVPAFALASVFSLGAGVLAVLKLPKLPNSYRSAGFHGFGWAEHQPHGV